MELYMLLILYQQKSQLFQNLCVIDGFVRTYGGNRYLTLFSSENYDAIYNGIRYFLWGFTILHTHPLPATLTHSHYISPTPTHSHPLSPTPTLFATLIHFLQIVGNEIQDVTA